jgi:hypothetical protein
MWIPRLENENSKNLQNTGNTNSMHKVLSFQNRIKYVNKLHTKQQDPEDMQFKHSKVRFNFKDYLMSDVMN